MGLKVQMEKTNPKYCVAWAMAMLTKNEQSLGFFRIH
jgi:hypothetical protein